ncbi:MAG: NmrA family NAD(P)-binding protein [Nitrospinota bacterium]|nr:NmrA family NAD(P)-binding protein [Nitrospinota bacterium]
MYVVGGVTGHTGSLVAQILLNRGERVRAIVRNRQHIYHWRDQGAEVVVADFNDSQALSFVLEGAKGAYLLTPQSVYDTHPQEKWACQNQSIVTAVKKARLKNTVFLSSMGAHRDKPGLVQALYDAEQKFNNAQIPVTLLRASYFYENWIPALGAVHEKSALPTFLKPKRSIPMVSVKDVARVAVDLLLNPPDSGRVVELTGPKDYSAQDIIDILEQIMGKRLDLLPFSEGGWEEVWGEEELPEEMNDLLEETYDGLNNNKITFSGKHVETRQGTVTLEEVLEKWVS